MKNMTLLFTSLMFFVSICSSCSTDEKPKIQEPIVDVGNKKVLTIYLSRTQNTKAVAEMIQQNVGGDLVALEVQYPYPADYRATVDQVAEENRTEFLPPLKTKIDSIAKYDVIFIGFPTWGMQLPPPFKSFLNEYNLKGKTIIPFNTNAGYGVGSGFETIKQLAPSSTVLKGFSVEGGKERDGILFVMEDEKEQEVKSLVINWLKELKTSSVNI